MNTIEFYKNFNMNIELDISGEFIYDGITTLKQIASIQEDACLFSFFYHVSVGIERLQKIIIVLSEKFDLDKFKQFEDNLRTHAHVNLQNRIKSYQSIGFNDRENDFLQLITQFYNKVRYSRYHMYSDLHEERKMMEKYIKKYISEDNICYDINNILILSEYIKEILGRIIGSITKKYYKLIVDESRKNNLYTYEIRYGSKAEKVFLNSYPKNSLFNQKIDEQIVLKEFLIYLINTTDTESILREIKRIKPLEFDSGLINYYIEQISNGVIPQELIDEVEQLYKKDSLYKERKIVNYIGDTNVLFDIIPYNECLKIINSFLNDKLNINEFILRFDDIVEYFNFTYEDDDKFERLIKKCKKSNELYRNNEISRKDFFCTLNKLKEILKKRTSFECDN